MRVAVGQGTFELTGAAVILARDTLVERMVPFLVQEDGPADWNLSIGLAFKPLFPWETAQWTTSGDEFSLEFTVFEARGRRDEHRSIQATVLNHNESHELVVDRIVGLVRSLATELWREDGVLSFHGAAVELIDGLGVLTLGPSGVGKTTFATGPWVHTRRSDDHALLRKDSHWTMPGVPFRGREGHPTTQGETRLNAIVLPEWCPGSSPQIVPIPQARATELLLRNLLCIDTQSEAFEANMEAIERLVSTVPVLRLRYDANLVDASLASLLSAALVPLQKAS
jgi:hypothetical protein